MKSMGLTARRKKYFSQNEMLAEGSEFKLVELNEREEVVSERIFNIEERDVYSTIMYKDSGNLSEVRSLKVMFIAVLNDSDEVRKVLLYRNSKLLGQARVINHPLNTK